MSTKYYFTSNGSLREIRDDELIHWKYIKREKVNGKWRYYYHDDAVTNLGREHIDAQRELNEAQTKSRKYREFVQYYQNQLDRANNGDVHATDANKNLQGWKKMRDNAAAEVAIAYRSARRIEQQYNKAREVYAKSAGHKVADFLNNASDAISKAEKWVKSLF